MRINANGQVLRELRVEVPQALFRALELQKGRTGLSLNQLAGGILIPALEQLLKESGALPGTGSAQPGDVGA